VRNLLLLAAAAALAMDFKGQNCPVETPGHRLIESPAAWTALWKDLGKPAPAQEFAKSFAVAVFAGRKPTGGWSIAFDEPKPEKDALVVRYAVKKPKGMATMALTAPYAVRTFAKTGRPVRVEERKP
jgi:hypothetical protein